MILWINAVAHDIAKLLWFARLRPMITYFSDTLTGGSDASCKLVCIWEITILHPFLDTDQSTLRVDKIISMWWPTCWQLNEQEISACPLSKFIIWMEARWRHSLFCNILLQINIIVDLPGKDSPKQYLSFKMKLHICFGLSTDVLYSFLSLPRWVRGGLLFLCSFFLLSCAWVAVRRMQVYTWCIDLCTWLLSINWMSTY